jgi:MFS family permease
MMLFTTASNVQELALARVLQGLSIGAAFGAVGAGLLDLNKSKGTIANAAGPLVGTATGAIGSSLLVQYLPAPTHLVYLVLFGAFALQGAGVLLMAESSAPTPGALASLRLQFGLPRGARAPFLVAAPALVAVWALVGFYGSLGPTLVGVLVGSHSSVLGGLALFALTGSAGIAVVLLRNAAPRALMLLGTTSLLVGVGITLFAITDNSTIAFFIGTVVAGVGLGAGLQGAIRSVLPSAAPHERSGVLSLLFAVSYLAFGVPAVIAGFLVVHSGDLLTTAREYGVAVMVLATLALIGVVRPTLRRAPAAQVVPCPQRTNPHGLEAESPLAEAC